MPRVANIERRGATYWWRRRVKLKNPENFPISTLLAVSLRTKEQSEARRRGALLTAYSERVRMGVEAALEFGRITVADCQRIMQAEIKDYLGKIENLYFEFHMDGLGDVDRKTKISTDAVSALFGAIARDGFTRDLAQGRALESRFPGIDADVREVIEELLQTVPNLGDGLLEAGRDPLGALGYAGTPQQLAHGRQLACNARVEAARLYNVGTTSDQISELTETPVGAASSAPSAPLGAVGASIMRPDASVPQTLPLSAVDRPGIDLDVNVSLMASWSPTQAADEYMRAKPKTGGNPDLDRSAFKKLKAASKVKVWGESARRQFRAAPYLMEKSMLGRPLASIQQSDLVALYDHFSRLPANHHKSPAHEAMTLEEICREFEDLAAAAPSVIAVPGLSVATVNRHMQNLRQLCEWLAKRVPMAKLDWDDFIFEKPDHDEQDDRDAYTVEQGRAIFNLPIWTGCLSRARRLIAGCEIWHDAFFFVMMLLWYSGARREEICKLMLDDFAELDGIKYFIIRETLAGGIKSSSSMRVIPLSNELLRLGLWQYIEAMRAAGETFAFPELRPGRDGPGMGDVFYKIRWTKMKPLLPFLKHGQAMHAGRHMVATELKQLQVFEEFRSDVLGHKTAQPGEKPRSQDARRYAKAAKLHVLLPIVNMIPVVTAHLPDFVSINLLPPEERLPRPVRESSGPRNRRPI